MPSPNERTPGVAMIQPWPPSPVSTRIDTVELDVWRPRPVTWLTTPVARFASGTRALTSVDLPTPEWPTATVVRSTSSARSSSSGTSSERLSTMGTSSTRKWAANGAGSATSDLVMQRIGWIPASNAATR